MATTTNFGWETPDDTDLVKDGASAIRTLGSAIDTSLVDLKGGTTGQVLSKASNTDLDYSWTTPTDQTPLTTKGDLFTYSTVDARLGVGTDGQYLSADSTASTGLKWITPTSGPGNFAQITTGTLSGTSVTLSSLSTYSELLLFINGYTWGTANSNLIVRVNNNSGANYSQFGWYDNAGTTPSRVSATGLTSFSNTYPESGQLQTNADGSFAIKFTNCKTTGFTDMDQKSIFYRNADSKYYAQNYKGVYSQNEAVSSLVITTSGGYTFSAGTYTLFGA